VQSVCSRRASWLQLVQRKCADARKTRSLVVIKVDRSTSQHDAACSRSTGAGSRYRPIAGAGGCGKADAALSTGQTDRRTDTRPLHRHGTAQSCPRVGLTHGLGRDFSVFGGLVGSTIAKVLNILKDYVNAYKERLDKIWLHQAEDRSSKNICLLISKEHE